MAGSRTSSHVVTISLFFLSILFASFYVPVLIQASVLLFTCLQFRRILSLWKGFNLLLRIVKSKKLFLFFWRSNLVVSFFAFWFLWLWICFCLFGRVVDFVVAAADPLTPRQVFLDAVILCLNHGRVHCMIFSFLSLHRKKKDRKPCRVWKWMWYIPLIVSFFIYILFWSSIILNQSLVCIFSNLPCFNIQWLCCCHCSFSFQLPKCCRSCKSCICTIPECDNGYSCCFQKSLCSTNCCSFACPTSSSCLHSLCTDWSCHMPKCAPWGCCCCCYNCKCINKCCNPCYSCCCM